MITTHIMGNIGNQLFIYAMARALQLEYGDKILFDLSGLKRGYYTANYKLDQFNLPQNISYDLKDLSICSRLKYKITSTIFHVQHYLNRYVRKHTIMPHGITQFWAKQGCFYCTDKHFFEYPKDYHEDKFIYGYFQSDRYFNRYRKELLNDLQVVTPISERDEEIIQKMKRENSVGISIRASKAFDNPKVTDNLNLGFIDKDFYYKGMEEIAKRVENPVFYIFADDIEIVKKEYKFPYPVIYVTPDDSATGIRLMYNCKHFIITNSTFSWWGAYLGRNKDKIVVMPNVWDRFGPLREDIYFGNPIKLSVTFLTE